MLLKQREVVFVREHRLIESQLRRHFFGRVLVCSQQAARAEGYVFLYDPNRGSYSRKPRKRTKIIPLVDSRLTIVVLPEETDIENIHYVEHPEGRLTVTDDRVFELDVSEFGGLR